MTLQSMFQILPIANRRPATCRQCGYAVSPGGGVQVLGYRKEYVHAGECADLFREWMEYGDTVHALLRQIKVDLYEMQIEYDMAWHVYEHTAGVVIHQQADYKSTAPRLEHILSDLAGITGQVTYRELVNLVDRRLNEKEEAHA